MIDASTAFPDGFLITVRPERNELGAWIARVHVSRGDQTILDTRPETVQPEWSTEEEAIRDATEWGRRYIDREFGKQVPRSWVVERARAEHWFEGVEKKDSH